ncbi:MAG: hypothetical protein AAGI68_10855 [Planctomycetota bacterium]
MIDRHDPNLLLDYLEGELPEEAAAEVAAAVRADPELRLLMEELGADRAALRAMPEAEPPSDLLEGVQAQLEREMLLGPPPEPIPLARGHRNTQPPAANQPSHLRDRLVFLGGLAALLALAAGITLYSLSQTSLLNFAGQNTPPTTPAPVQPPRTATPAVPSATDPPSTFAVAPNPASPEVAALPAAPTRLRNQPSDPSTAAWFIGNTSASMPSSMPGDLGDSPPLSNSRADTFVDGVAIALESAPLEERVPTVSEATAVPGHAMQAVQVAAVPPDRLRALADEVRVVRATGAQFRQGERSLARPAQQQIILAAQDAELAEEELIRWAAQNRVAVLGIDQKSRPARVDLESRALADTEPLTLPETAASEASKESAAGSATSSLRAPTTPMPMPVGKSGALRRQHLARDESASDDSPAPASAPALAAPPRRLLLQVNTDQIPQLIDQLAAVEPSPEQTRQRRALATSALRPHFAFDALPQRFPQPPSPPPGSIDALVFQNAGDWVEVVITPNP